MILEDGRGTGRKAEIDENNHLHVRAFSDANIAKLNADRGTVWSFPIDAVAPSGATKFFYVGNNEQQDIIVAVIRLASTVAGVFRFLRVTGTPTSVTVVTPVGLNFGKVVGIPGPVYSGTNIGGLTDAGLCLPVTLVANTMLELPLVARWRIGPGTALAIQAPAAAVVSGHFLAYRE